MHCETESVPAQTGLSVDSLLQSNKGNGNGGNSVRKGESFTPPLAECFCWLSSSPKSPDGYCFAILALTGKLWLAVLCARLLKGLRLFVGLACCLPAGVHRRSLLHRVQGRP